jgi:hypothetical protein
VSINDFTVTNAGMAGLVVHAPARTTTSLRVGYLSATPFIFYRKTKAILKLPE